MKHPKFSRAFEVVGKFPDELQSLKKLAFNFWWTWNHEPRELFRNMDKDLWDECDHNPVLFLNRLSQDKLSRLASDVSFVARLSGCSEQLDQYLSAETWFDRAYPGMREHTQVAYFCFEFGITEGLPIYSGGLGVLAGDHLKAASDLGIPLVGLGLLYNRGYFRQRLSHDGWQQEHYPQYDFYQMPLTLMRKDDGSPIRIEVPFPDRTVSCQVWKADVGRIPLYLLDSNVLENAPNDQGITDSLYSGDEEMRIRQEIILGIGGLKALEALGIKPTVCHMNEGHAAFLSIERIRQFMKERGTDFRTARQATVGANVFTTHTPVPAGFDMFHPSLLERYMTTYANEVGLDFQSFLKLGRTNPENPAESFNMAILAMENSNHVNGVAQLHGAVSRGMFAGRWPDYPEDEVPIGAVTNGIHTSTWVSRRMANLFDEYLGTGWRRNPSDPANWEQVDSIPDEELWAEIENLRGELVRFARRKLSKDLERRSFAKPDSNFVSNILDPRVLTIGFARRFATYKRGSLMLSDRERLKQLLFHPERPIQIVIAGKSHPRDEAGKKIIQDLVNFINNEGARNRMVFLEDYDMQVARRLVQGVDLWLNNPRRPYEASGTSGMKVVPNGGLNCSILDGWWDEAYKPGLGWAIGDRSTIDDYGHQDWLDSRSLYHLIEHEISPVFYHRVDKGIPVGWVQMIKRSLKEHAPFFSTARMVQDYTDRYYVPAAFNFKRMTENGLEATKSALGWRQRIKANWARVQVVSVKDNVSNSNTVGSSFRVEAVVELADLRPEDVRVQVVSGKVGPNRELVHTAGLDCELADSEGTKHRFHCNVVCDRLGHQGYTVRVVPKHSDVGVPSELNLVRWQS